MASQVEIHLPVQGTTESIHAFTIPTKDIRKLTFRPLKWLRFATFAVCGAKGHLSTTQGGVTADYENVTFDSLAERYWYNPVSEYRFVDLTVIDNRVTSSDVTERRGNFRREVLRRDESCVITREDPALCHVAHIISRSKGEGYIHHIIEDRSSLYDEPRPLLQHGINSIENGMVLRTDLHSKFDAAEIGFLRTPNFAMLPADVPQVVAGPVPDKRTTLQHIQPPKAKRQYVVPQGDVDADWSCDELPPPPSILLDFMYGAAVAERWKSDQLNTVLEERFKSTYDPVLAKAKFPPANSGDDIDYTPGSDSGSDRLDSREEGVRETETRSKGLLRMMDYMLLLPMVLQGIPPEEVAARWERQRKEAQIRDQKSSAMKVQQWLDSGSDHLVS